MPLTKKGKKIMGAMKKTYGDTKTFAGTEFTSSGLQNSETIGSVTLASTGAAAARLDVARFRPDPGLGRGGLRGRRQDNRKIVLAKPVQPVRML